MGSEGAAVSPPTSMQPSLGRKRRGDGGSRR